MPTQTVCPEPRTTRTKYIFVMQANEGLKYYFLSSMAYKKANCIFSLYTCAPSGATGLPQSKATLFEGVTLAVKKNEAAYLEDVSLLGARS
jgi:hypothetical protein